MSNVETFVTDLGKIIEQSQKSKIFICGNGGSSSQASHLAAELMVRYKVKRNRFFAVALSSDAAITSAISNDFCYDDVFSMQLENMANENDILIALSTSGKSNNIVNALKLGKTKKMKTVAFLGKDGGEAKDNTDMCFIVPSDDTAQIQEIHLMIIHLLCEYIENIKQ